MLVTLKGCVHIYHKASGRFMRRSAGRVAKALNIGDRSGRTMRQMLQRAQWQEAGAVRAVAVRADRRERQ